MADEILGTNVFPVKEGSPQADFFRTLNAVIERIVNSKQKETFLKAIEEHAAGSLSEGIGINPFRSAAPPPPITNADIRRYLEWAASDISIIGQIILSTQIIKAAEDLGVKSTVHKKVEIQQVRIADPVTQVAIPTFLLGLA
jgi:hypothetical protein